MSKTMGRVMVVGEGLPALLAAQRFFRNDYEVLLLSPRRLQSRSSWNGTRALEIHEATVTAMVQNPQDERWLTQFGGLLSAHEQQRLIQTAQDVLQNLNHWRPMVSALAGAAQSKDLSPVPLGKLLADQALQDLQQGVLQQRVHLYEHWPLQQLVQDDWGRCIGGIFLNHRSGDLYALRADAIVVALPGMDSLWGNQRWAGHTEDLHVYQQLFNRGADLAQLEFGAWSPWGLRGRQGPIAIPEVMRSSKDQWIITASGASADGRVLRATTKAQSTWQESRGARELQRLLEDRKFRQCAFQWDAADWLQRATGTLEHQWMTKQWVNSQTTPDGALAMEQHLGGLLVDHRGMSGVAGVFALANSSAAYPSIEALGPWNFIRQQATLADCVQGLGQWLQEQSTIDATRTERCFDRDLNQARTLQGEVFDLSGPENPLQWQADLSLETERALRPILHDTDLRELQNRMDRFSDRSLRWGLPDKSRHLNQSYSLVLGLRAWMDLLPHLAHVSLARQESRGCFFMRGFIEQDDDRFAACSRLHRDAQGQVRVLFEQPRRISQSPMSESLSQEKIHPLWRAEA